MANLNGPRGLEKKTEKTGNMMTNWVYYNIEYRDETWMSKGICYYSDSIEITPTKAANKMKNEEKWQLGVCFDDTIVFCLINQGKSHFKGGHFLKYIKPLKRPHTEYCSKACGL